MGYWWSTRYKVPDSDPVEYASAQILFTPQGNVYSSVPPTDDEHLTNKAYVDTSVTNATS
jgi:hypothetical protein